MILVRLVQGVFELTDGIDISKGKVLLCLVCEVNNKSRHLKLIIENPDYKKIPGIKQPKWFGNFKMALLRHICREQHVKAADKYCREQSLFKDKKRNIMDVIRYLSYFAIKSNLSFENYPTLLATVNRYDISIFNFYCVSLFIILSIVVFFKVY